MTEQKKYLLLKGLIASSIVPIPFIVSQPTLGNGSSMALYLSAVIGYVGIVLLLWMYILGAKSVIGLYLRDIARVTKLHSKLGKYGILLIFAHPLAAALAYGENAVLYALVPNLSTQFETYVTFGRIAFYALLVVWVTSAFVRGRIAYRPWKYIHYIAYFALPFALLHIPTIGSSYQSHLAAQLYYLSIVGLYTLFSLLRVRQLFTLGKTRYTVQSHSSVTADIMLLRLRAISSNAIRVKKGQYVYLQTNLLGEEHPFSVLQYNEDTSDITIAYKTFGKFTNKLTELQTGTDIYLDGPYGNFTEEINEEPNKPVVFIAGGIGITPFFDHILHDTSAEQWLFYANRTEESSAFADLLKTKLGTRCVSILSADNTTIDTSPERGYIDATLFKKYLHQPSKYRYFICGPPPMMRSTLHSLLSLGVPSQQIYSEEFSV